MNPHTPTRAHVRRTPYPSTRSFVRAYHPIVERDHVCETRITRRDDATGIQVGTLDNV